REIAVDATVHRIEAEASTEAGRDINRHRSVDGLEIHVLVALQCRHPRVDVSIHRFGAHRTYRGVDVNSTIHRVRPHWTVGVAHSDATVHGVGPYLGTDIPNRDTPVDGMSADLDRSRHPNRELHRSMV